LQDTLEIGDGEGIQLHVAGADVGPIESNLAYRAAQEYFLAIGEPPRISIRLQKHIPARAGLGGGSSDAAAVLRALQERYQGALSETDLLALAARLGSDVPFFLCGSPLAHARGRGEMLTQVAALPRRAVLVIMPDFGVATRDAYRWLDETGKVQAGDVPSTLPRDWQDVEKNAINDFEPVLFARYPALRELRDDLRRSTADIALVSGSGSALFGLFLDEAKATAAARVFAARAGVNTHLAHTIP
jgi:4-diphosphocytidyl-2-C-methyl-D-erythritol kinase